MKEARARKKAVGLARLELWVPKELHEQVREYAKNLQPPKHSSPAKPG
jgi:hypothetical protein